MTAQETPSGTPPVTAHESGGGKWFVVCDWQTRPDRQKDAPPLFEDRVWTVSRDPNETGWRNDMDCQGYGLPRTEAEFLSIAANDHYRLAAQVKRYREALDAVVNWNRFAGTPWERLMHVCELAQSALHHPEEGEVKKP